MRILLTWELGLNLGHVARLLPIAQRLKSESHTVLVAARDVQAASAILGPSGIPFVQAPHLPKGIQLAHRATGYADIVLSQGWTDASALWGLTQSWLNLFALFKPDKLLLDYSPTASLAARIASISYVLVGNGFELPPATCPLPPFPGFSWATEEGAAKSESLAVGNANRVLRSYRSTEIVGLMDLAPETLRIFATYPELDHYEQRREGVYVGPLCGLLPTLSVDWPRGQGSKIFACLRPDTNHLATILTALVATGARVVCVAMGFPLGVLERYRADTVAFMTGPVNLQLLGDADLCITYGAEGTIMRFLQLGVPQLISPWHVESHMAARRMATNGLGASIGCAPDHRSVADTMFRTLSDRHIRNCVTAFSSNRMANYSNTLSAVVEAILASTDASSPRASDAPRSPNCVSPGAHKEDTHGGTTVQLTRFQSGQIDAARAGLPKTVNTLSAIV